MASIKKRGDSYTIRVCLGYDPNGKRQSVSKTWKPDCKMSPAKELEEAKRVAHEFEEELKGGYQIHQGYTLRRYIDEIWLSKAYKELKPNTYRRYVGLLKRILPSLGHMKLDQIQPPQIRALLDDLAEDKREDLKYTPKKKAIELAAFSNKTQLAKKCGIAASTILCISRGNKVKESSAIKFAKAFDMKTERLFDRNEEPLSPTTILHHFRVLSVIMTSAMYDGYVKDNPLRRVKPPKAGKHKNSYLNDEQARQLIQLSREKAPHPFDMIIYTLIQTGMRRGECCALSWDDVDFENKTIRIARALLYLPGKGVFEDTPKNESSVRVIKVASNLIEELRAYKQWQEHEAESAGAKGRIWENSGRIFTSATGGNINPGTVTSWFHKFVLDNDLPYISIHGLRHTNASIMISRGVPITTAAKRLGHSTPATTAKIYAHEIDSVDAKTAEMFNDYFENKD